MLAIAAFYGYNGYLLMANDLDFTHLAVDIVGNRLNVGKVADILTWMVEPTPTPTKTELPDV